ncbi:3-hydroxyacyl-CoA dehydrogenase [Arenicella sp. 4NH20-0111]|uniref:SDR family NAD(P)-dependent oxidoreductase n=1 Tax=Arenicella sp. 4NH20-0111 TaxID=3127648 RepID=UPI00310A8708
MDINEKVAVITGGASGLGEATARHYISLGARVAIFDMNRERGSELVAELGSKARYFDVDVTSADSVEREVSNVIELFGSIHVVNNFAGIGTATKTISKDGPGDYDLFKKVIDVNLNGTFNVCRVAAYEMSKNEPIGESGSRGVIINTASVAAFEGQIGQAAYSASKGAIVGMTLTLARDLARNGIRVNTIAPGLIHTPLFDALPDEVYKSLEGQVLFPQRLGQASEIAHVAQMLVENDYMNGETVRMDGGIRMQAR